MALTPQEVSRIAHLARLELSAAEQAQMLSQLWASLWPAIESLLQVAPALAGGVMVVGWLVWGVGAVLLVLLGAGLHMGIAVWTRRRGRASTRRWRAEVAG